jgi:hypothetical protein
LGCSDFLMPGNDQTLLLLYLRRVLVVRMCLVLLYLPLVVVVIDCLAFGAVITVSVKVP